jgi:hypothetical protein
MRQVSTLPLFSFLACSSPHGKDLHNEQMSSQIHMQAKLNRRLETSQFSNCIKDNIKRSIIRTLKKKLTRVLI